jgi:molybdenum cofactor cytidylyltransferase
MATASRADPELVGSPRSSRGRIAHFHLGAAPLTPDVQVDVAHRQRFYYDDHVIPAIVLAAGKSSRMGRPKGTLPLGGGDTFATRIVRTFAAAAIEDVVIVVGHDADAIVDAFARTDLSPTFVENADFEQGQLSSLLAGLRVVDRPGVVAALVTLVDVPLIGVPTVRAVVERYLTTGAPIVRPVRDIGDDRDIAGRRGQQHGHPVLIDRSLFDVLRRADPRAGAKAIVRAYASSLGDVEVDDDGAFADIDTPAEYERLRAAFE